MLKRPNIYKVTCEICFKQDEFFLCNKCFSLYLEKSITFEQSTHGEKVRLKSSIQEILNKNYESLLLYNHKFLKINKLEKLKKNIKQTSTILSIKQTLINSFSNEITKKKENLIKFRGFIDKERKKYKFNSEENFTQYMKETESSLGWKKNQIANILMKIFFINSIDSQEYFEIQEYVKPEYKMNNNDDKSIKESDFREFDKIPNILSFSDSLLFKIQDAKEYDFNYEKSVKFKKNVLRNKINIFRLNSFIYCVMSGIKFLSSIFNLPLPYEIQQVESYLIYNPVNDQVHCLYLPYELIMNSDPDADKKLNEILQGYIYLDINLKFITNILNLKENKKEANFKIYKRCLSFRNLHAIFTPDIKEFLNVKSLIPEEDEFFFHHVHMSDEYKFMDMEIVGSIKNEEEEEFENHILTDKIVNEKVKTTNSEFDEYVLIENYFS